MELNREDFKVLMEKDSNGVSKRHKLLLYRRIELLVDMQGYVQRMARGYVEMVSELCRRVSLSIENELRVCEGFVSKDLLDLQDLEMIQVVMKQGLPPQPSLNFDLNKEIPENFEKFLRPCLKDLFKHVKVVIPPPKPDSLYHTLQHPKPDTSQAYSTIPKSPILENQFDPSTVPDLFLESHLSSINSLAISSSELYLFTASNDKTIRMWDLDAMKQVKVLSGHSSMISSIIVSADDSFLVSCSIDSKVFVWDLNIYEKRFELLGHADLVKAVCLSRDNQYLISGSKDKNVAVYNLLQSLDPVLLPGHASTVLCVIFNWEETKIISGSSDSTIKIWNKLSTSLEFTLAGHEEGVNSLINLGKFEIASCSSDKTIRIWDTFNMVVKNKIPGHTGQIYHLFYCPELQIVLSSSLDHTVKVWDVETWKQLTVFSKHSSAVIHSIVLKNRKVVVSGSKDRTVRIWRPSCGTEEAVLPGHTGRVLLTAVSENYSVLVTFGADKTLRSWSLYTRKEILCKEASDPITQMALTADGSYLVTKSTTQTWIWETSTLTKFQQLSTRPEIENWVQIFPNLFNFLCI